MESSVQHFYKGKHVFVTGGSGFLGKVYIEKILRSTEVGHVYVLIRAKKSKDIRERIKDLFNDPLFDELRKVRTNPENCVTAIAGDCALPNLGISEADHDLLVENVEVVVHSAATVRFNEPLSMAFTINVRATIDLIQLGKKMRKLQAFVHVSSAFANCTQTNIEERSYTHKLPIGVDKMCGIVDLLDSDVVDRLETGLRRDFPNTYTFTKALAEEAILTKGIGLPICIFRPAIVISTHEEPVPGWIGNFYGPIGLLYGSGLGVLRVLFISKSSNASIVPVDFCANMILASAWSVATNEGDSVKQQTSLPPIYNLVPAERNPIKWIQFQESLENHRTIAPLSQMIWYPFFIQTDSPLLYKVLCFLYHTIPGYIFDSFLCVLGQTPRLVKAYRKVHNHTDLLSYFTTREWTFSIDNSKELWRSLSVVDQRQFPFDMEAIVWPPYLSNCVWGMRRYLAKDDTSTLTKAKRLIKIFYVLHHCVELLVIIGFLALIWWLSKLFV